MTAQETVKVSADLVLTTEQGEVPRPEEIAGLIMDQMHGVLSEETGLECAFVNVVAVTGELDQSMALNEHGDYELQLEDGLIVARFTSEGMIADWFHEDGTADRTLAVDWDNLYEQSNPS